MKHLLKSRTRPGTPIEHGGPDSDELRALGIDANSLIDFSVCTNPYGPSLLVNKALADARIDAYPERHCSALRTALANKHHMEPRRILVGNGASELIEIVNRTFVAPG